MRHKITNINPELKTADCQVCGAGVSIKYRSKNPISFRCRQQFNTKRGYRKPYAEYKKDECDKCGFKGHTCQLDVDHIDSNHFNNDPNNLQTLCANCHRLKSYLERRES